MLGCYRPHIVCKVGDVVGDHGVLMIAAFCKDVWLIMATSIAVGSIQNADIFFWWRAILLVWIHLSMGLLLCAIRYVLVDSIE